MSQLSVSIVIPCHNSAATIGETIEACLAQSFSGQIEVIVVDDGSTDQTAMIVTKYPEVRYLYQSNKGPAAARNRGWRAASGSIVCFTDSDCVPNPCWVARLVAAYNDHQIGGVGGSYSLLNPDSLLASCIHQEIMYRHHRMGKQAVFLGSYNASFRRRVLEEVGGFDETYKMASAEDNALSYRVIRLGYRLIFDVHNTVGHYHPVSLRKYLIRQFWHGYWRVKLYRDHPGMMRGDGYSGIRDFVQPPLYLLMLICLPFVWLPAGLYTVASLLAVGMLMQVDLVCFACRQTGDWKHLILAPIIIVRGIARGFGMLWGIVRFCLVSRRFAICW